jgi:hypothetical protein
VEGEALAYLYEKEERDVEAEISRDMNEDFGGMLAKHGSLLYVAKAYPRQEIYAGDKLRTLTLSRLINVLVRYMM